MPKLVQHSPLINLIYIIQPGSNLKDFSILYLDLDITYSFDFKMFKNKKGLQSVEVKKFPIELNLYNNRKNFFHSYIMGFEPLFGPIFPYSKHTLVRATSFHQVLKQVICSDVQPVLINGLRKYSHDAVLSTVLII